MSHEDFESYDNEPDQNGDPSLDTRSPVSKLPGKGAVLVLFGSGSLLSGLGLLQSFYLTGAFGQSSVVGGLTQRASEIGWTPSALTIGGLMMIGLGSIASSLLNTGRNLLGEIVHLPDPSNTLEELDVQQQKLHVSMVNVQGSIERAVQTSFKSLREQLLGIEGRIYNVESTMGGADRAADEQEREQALARFALKLDSFSGRIESKIDARLEQFEQGLSEELVEVTSSLAETLIGKFRNDEAERSAEQERSHSAREVADRARREAESKTATPAPTLPEFDSLGVFDALDDEGRPVPSPPAPTAGPRPRTQAHLQQQFAQQPPAQPAAPGVPQAPTPAPQPPQPRTRMEALGALPQSPTDAATPNQVPPMLSGQPQAAHQEPGAHWQQQAVHGGRALAPDTAAYLAQVTPQPLDGPPPAAPQASAPRAMGHQPAAPQQTQAPQAAHTPRLDETAVRPELRLVESGAEEPGAPLPRTPPAREERRLEAIDPYGDFSSPADPSGGPQQR